MTADQIFSVQGKTAIVTGAASGLGFAMAEALAENGANVTCFDLNEKRLAAAAEMLRAHGGQVMTFVGDVVAAAPVQNAIAATVDAFGGLDICVANAGISDRGDGLFHDREPADWTKVVDVNLHGLALTNRTALAQMMAQGHGKVINVASMWGLVGASGLQPRPAYSATKGAVINLTRELGVEYAPYNIQVNAICPGFFRTETRPKDAAQEAAFCAYTPMGRIAEADEIKGSLLYLASAASDFVTGTALVIDGGVTAA